MDQAASRFGQRLAHTEKKQRDAALRKLTKYLRSKREWAPLDWDKLWKALFYCMWMSDKRPVQEELSSNLAGLLHVLPTRELALGFAHSFFRTMHREWHGLDGLRLDKFYSLVRKVLREGVALLANHDWDEDAVTEFVSILSTEVVSQLPNGLRMHLADLYIAEICRAAGDSVTTEAFVLLLEPFFALLGSEYDKTVFKRVRELVFLPMLSQFTFGDAAEDKDGDETDEDDDEEPKAFPLVDITQVQHRIFAIASAEGTAERNRAALYDLYAKFQELTQIDSLKAAQEEPKPKKKQPKKVKQSKAEAEAEPVQESKPVDVVVDSGDKKKKKKKKRKHAATSEEEQTTGEQAEESTPSPKKQKTAEPAKTVVPAEDATKKSKKDKKKAKQPEPVKEQEKPEDDVPAPKKKAKKATKEAEKESIPAEEATKKSKKDKKKVKQPEAVKEQEDEVPASKKKANKATKEAEKEAAPVVNKDTKKKSKKAEEAEAEPKAAKATEPKEKKAKPTVIVKSGVKFQRCASCGGFGKNLVRAGKDKCGHCERGAKALKKASASASKKRKAEVQRAAADEAAAEAATAKKVTFGKNKALPHSLSVKRLKASAKKDAVPKEDGELKGVLKQQTSPPAKKSKKKARMKASDFF